MSIPLPFVVGIRTFASGAEDSHGNPVDSWGSAVDTPAFWWSPTSTEPLIAGHDRVIVDLVVVVDSSTEVGPHDRVDVLGKTYEVIGEPLDFDHGPFGYSPKRKPINLKRVEG